jgi:sigma-B regulation protein RsbU (phosphoserine phosphatase)
VGDVTGHGVGPAILMSSLRSLTRAIVHRDLSIDGILTFLNRQLEQDTDEGIFISFFLGILDLENRCFTYGNAGHCPPLLYKSSSGEFVELKRTGMALGIVGTAPYSAAESVDLEPGDLLALFTDGVLEAQRGDELFGPERFQNLIREGAQLPAYQLIDRIFSSVREFIGTGGHGDDLTLSVLKVL